MHKACLLSGLAHRGALRLHAAPPIAAFRAEADSLLLMTPARIRTLPWPEA